MNDKKFAFVMCANNEQYEKEALYYIERLEGSWRAIRVKVL